MFPDVVWAGSFDEKLFRLITAFAMNPSINQTGLSGPIQAVRTKLFDERTVETLCNAAINAEDAVACNDAAGNESRHPTSILTEAEKERIFGMTHSPYYGPLVGLANIVKDSSRMRPGLDLNASIYQPLKKYWSQMIKHLWDFPSRSLGSHDMFQEERYLLPFIFFPDRRGRSFFRQRH